MAMEMGSRASRSGAPVLLRNESPMTEAEHVESIHYSGLKIRINQLVLGKIF